MEKAKYTFRITFITPVLGAQPTIDVASDYIAAKHEEIAGTLPDDEAETLPQALERGTTVFHRDASGPMFFDYQVKGFLKEAGRIFNGLNDVKALRSKVENLVFVTPRRIQLHIPDGKQADYLERPLRAETAQGPRIALARSEQLPEGTWFEITIEIYKGQVNKELVCDLMTYGEKKGLGQWRNGGFGRFTFQEVK